MAANQLGQKCPPLTLTNVTPLIVRADSTECGFNGCSDVATDDEKVEGFRMSSTLNSPPHPESSVEYSLAQCAFD